MPLRLQTAHYARNFILTVIGYGVRVLSQAYLDRSPHPISGRDLCRGEGLGPFSTFRLLEALCAGILFPSSCWF